MSQSFSHLELPIRAATEMAIAHGVVPDRCDILQDGHTLVVRLTETVVARVVTDTNGPRQGTGWFDRETDIARHLTQQGAPVIPLHAQMPETPVVHLGYTMNFWQFVHAIEEAPAPGKIGETLFQCHEALRSFPKPLRKLAILTESLEVIEKVNELQLLPLDAIQLLKWHLLRSIHALQNFPHFPLHGDAHLGNLMNTRRGLLWTDWEDAFSGPVEWDLASVIWNAKILENDHATVELILQSYQKAGGQINPTAMHHSLIARAAVMSVWYPILYPNPDAARREKLQRRLEWLEQMSRVGGEPNLGNGARLIGS